VAATSHRPDVWNPWHGGASGIAYVALLAPAFVVSPGLLQKIYGARDDRTVRLGVAGNALVLLAFAVVPPLFGIAARALHPDLAQRELALPTVLMLDLPPWLGGLGLAAVVSAEISAADAILFMLSTSLSQDLYRRVLRPLASDAEVLRVARGASVLGGGAGVLLAIAAPTVIGALSLFYSILSVCLFVPVVAGLYARRVGAPEAWAAIGAGMVALLAGQLAGPRSGGFGLSPAFLRVGRRWRGRARPPPAPPPPTVAPPTSAAGRSEGRASATSIRPGTSASPRRPRPRAR
jgi:SSS family solute:Na+ symporter